MRGDCRKNGPKWGKDMCDLYHEANGPRACANGCPFVPESGTGRKAGPSQARVECDGPTLRKGRYSAA